MPDPIDGLPSEEEAPSVLLTQAIADFKRANDGYQEQTADLLTALFAVFADEAAILYGLAREVVEDDTLDLGREIYKVSDPSPTPARATTRWTARPGQSGTVTPGEILVIDAPQGRLSFEALDVATVTDQAPVDIVVQAVTAGAAANNATGEVMFDQRPAWTESVVVTAPAEGGEDAADTDEQKSRIRRAASLQTQAAVDVDDAMLKIVDVPGVERAAVINRLDPTTGEYDTGQAGYFAVDADGEDITDLETQNLMVAAVTGSNRLLGGTLINGRVSYCTIRPHITVKAARNRDPTVVGPAVAAAAQLVLSPARHGLPDEGEEPVLLVRPTVHHYAVAGALATSDLGVEYVENLSFEVVDGDGTIDEHGNVVMGGYVPLPRCVEPDVTVLDPDQ